MAAGKEPARDHPPLTTPIGEIKHHYYGSSPDYDGIDPESPGGLRATKAVCGFTHFMAALRKEGYSVSDLVANVPFYTPTEDTTGWSYENDIEKRYMQVSRPDGVQSCAVNRSFKCLQTAPSPWLTGELTSFLTFGSGVTRNRQGPRISRESSSEAVQRIAQAFLKDVGSQRLCFLMDAIVLRHDLVPFQETEELKE